MKNAIEIKNIEKKYKKGFKLEKTNIKIQSGTITGLIGENGAGKTTLLKIILGIIKQDSGEIKIFNQNLKTHENKIKEDIGVVLDNAFFPETLNPKNINNIMKDKNGSLNQRFVNCEKESKLFDFQFDSHFDFESDVIIYPLETMDDVIRFDIMQMLVNKVKFKPCKAV